MPCMLCAPLSNSTPRMSVVTIIWGVNAKMNDRKEPHVVCALSEHVLVVHDGDEEVHRVRHRNVAHGKIRRKVSIRVLKVIVRFLVPLEKLVVVLVFDVQLAIDTKLVAFCLARSMRILSAEWTRRWTANGSPISAISRMAVWMRCRRASRLSSVRRGSGKLSSLIVVIERLPSSVISPLLGGS